MTEYSEEMTTLLKGSNRHLILIGIISMMFLVFAIVIFGSSFTIPIKTECKVLDIQIANPTRTKPLRLSNKQVYVLSLEVEDSIIFDNSLLSRVSIINGDIETHYNIISIISHESSKLIIEVNPVRKTHESTDEITQIVKNSIDPRAELFGSGLRLYKHILQGMSHKRSTSLKKK